MVMTIAFELQGQQFVALNGAPGFPLPTPSRWW
jgi:predicted 3-demethylubiquinone-9 3-methyltransferase (glyoxalase superfamily)